jgi:hypothetical protein
MENSFHFFPLWKRGMKGDLTAFQKAKLLLKPILSFLGRFKKLFHQAPDVGLSDQGNSYESTNF